MTRRARLLFLLVALGIAVVVIGSWWPVHRADVRAREAVSLKAAWEARTLTLRPDGCLDLKTDGGRRSFIFEAGAWRECRRRR